MLIERYMYNVKKIIFVLFGFKRLGLSNVVYLFRNFYYYSLLGWGVECRGYWFLMIWDFKC